MKKIKLLSSLFMAVSLFSQNIITPLQQANYLKVTSYLELSQFIKEVDLKSDLIKSEVLTKSIEGRELFAVYFSKNGFGKDKSKIRVLIFAQQHGNEQSGKEGALFLITELLKPENQYLFEKIDFVLVPQMNPDGSEKNKRRNGNDVDVNRNHLILTEPETIALHKLVAKVISKFQWMFMNILLTENLGKNLDIEEISMNKSEQLLILIFHRKLKICQKKNICHL